MAIKRLVDVAGATALLILSAPLWLIIAILVRLDSPGPALFSQQRIGLHGRPFTLFKFRTMRQGAEQEWQPPDASELDSYIFQDDGDPRITRIGRFLRRTSLDELPQLINILKGEMSLVGPRPEVPEIVALYEPRMHRRHAMRPGLTGLAQVSGRGTLTTGETLVLDLAYCEEWSLRLDLAILGRTFCQVVGQKGAR
ncbi:sugar transferase [Sulfobacillus sp. DSM 109850]|uniref:Sugar transferase n=1 Tax=Sulfobacillus harzensis TaxID=2729629 RepID=A0A7Y0L3R8_9FIRM|nr:sugar transferase [Sulfobacillus harzensis]